MNWSLTTQGGQVFKYNTASQSEIEQTFHRKIFNKISEIEFILNSLFRIGFTLNYLKGEPKVSQKWIKMDKKEKLKMKLIELAKSGNLDLEQFPESIRQKISQIRQNEGMIFNPWYL